MGGTQRTKRALFHSAPFCAALSPTRYRVSYTASHLISILKELLIDADSSFVPHRVVESHQEAPHGDHEQEAGIDPVTHRVPLGSLLCLIDPYTDDLARRTHRDIEGNCQPDRRRRV